jgi:lipopolysaccharide heptosyltransferase II
MKKRAYAQQALEAAQFAIYLVYRAVVALVCVLPLESNFKLGRVLGTICCAVAWPYRRLVVENLTIAFGGEKSPDEIRSLAREHFASLGANLLSSFKVASMSPAEIDALLTVENAATMHAALAKGRGVVMVISHIGNWELFAQLTHYLPDVKTSTVYQALGNRFIDEHMKETRARAGVVPFDRKDGFNAPIKFLRDGGLVGVLVDQHAGDGGVWTPLFGRLASTSPLAATLAVRTGAELVPVAIYTDGLAHWRIVVSEPVAHEGGEPEQVTAEINVALEKQIRVSPRDWFWVHNRWKTPSPKFLLATYKRGIVYPRNSSPGSGQVFDEANLKPFRMLIRSTNWLGDAVMSVPAVRVIKAGRPDARVTVLTRDKLADFWKRVPEVDEVISFGANDGVLAVAKKIAGRFDAAILFPNSIRAALEARLAGVPRRVGFRAKWRTALLNQMPREKKKKPGPPKHQVFRYLQLAEFIGAGESLSAHLAPAAIERRKLVPSPAERPKIESRKIALCPGAEYGPAKRWHAERFAEAAKTVAAKTACEWVLVGTEKDAPIGAQIAAALDGKCTNLIGKTTLAELIDTLAQCRVLLTNDTGTMHLAAFLGVPVVAVFGSTEPALTGPLGPGRVIRHHVECSPCFLRTCPIDFRCMNAVEVGEVVDAVVQVLDERRR